MRYVSQRVNGSDRLSSMCLQSLDLSALPPSSAGVIGIQSINVSRSIHTSIAVHGHTEDQKQNGSIDLCERERRGSSSLAEPLAERLEVGDSQIRAGFHSVIALTSMTSMTDGTSTTFSFRCSQVEGTHNPTRSQGGL